MSERPSVPEPARAAALVLASLLVLLSCSAATTGPDAIGRSPSSGAPPTDGPGGDPSGTASPRPDPTVTGSRAPTVGSRPTGGGAAAYADRGPVGGMARSYLRASPGTRLIVEIDYAAGREPSSAALQHLESILRRELRKPGGIVFDVDTELRPAGRYRLEDLNAIEQRHRARRSGGEVATMYLLFLDGNFDEPGFESAIGIAFLGSAAAIFVDQIRSAATALIRPTAIERAVLLHEVGHLLGLVNLVYTSRHDHEDPDHPKHSRFRDSVMFWAVEDVSVSSILQGGPPDDFNRFDRDDLAFLRGE